MFDTLTRIGAAGAGTTAYEIQKSLRINDGDSAYLHRTFSSDGNLRLFTYSFWFKCEAAFNVDGLESSYPIFGAGYSGGGHTQGDSGIRIDAGKLKIYHETNNSTDWSLEPAMMFVDPSAWYHLVMAFDTAQASADNRLKVWINGVQIETFTSTGRPAQDADCKQNKANVRIAARDGSGSPYDYFEGYLAEWHVVDGAAREAADFGEFSASTGQWVPKAYTGSHGTNGYYLDFSDNSGATASTIGADASANSNNFTPVNISVSSGVGNDSFEDTPTNNFCTLSGVDGFNGFDGSTTIQLTQGSLVANTTAGFRLCCGTIWLTEGKWYWEVICDDTGNGFVGISGQDELINNRGAMYDSNSFNIRTTNGNKYLGDGNDHSYGSAISDGDVVMVAVDMDNGKAWIGKAGTWFNSGDPAAGSNAGKTGIAGPVRPSLSFYDNEDYTMNFGANMDFAHTPPTGFKKVNTSNLATPQIQKATDHFNIKEYTGNGTSQTVSGVGFNPDLTIIKRRSGATADFIVADQGRGAQKRLILNTNANESAQAQDVSSFNSDGFVVGSNAYVNASSAPFVSWNWKAGGSNSSNGSGTITSNVNANTTAGFSIVTYTGDGNNGATVGHGLGVAPEIIWIKAISKASQHWIWGHDDAGWTHYHRTSDAASGTGGPTDDDDMFNDTAPTSTVFTIGDSDTVNDSSETYIAYCWASVPGFSKIGKYRGDTTYYPFVYTGFTPRLIYSTIGGHRMIQYRDVPGYNKVNVALLGSYNNAEEAATYFESKFYANGFGFTSNTGANLNSNGATGYYMAFAEAPFKYSPGR